MLLGSCLERFSIEFATKRRNVRASCRVQRQTGHDDDKQDRDRGQRNGKEKIEMGEGGHVLSRKIALDLGWIMKHDCLS